jgi:steroid delta-isomerase-like uncharacterized protein
MSTEENKARVRRLFEEVWNTGDLARADEFVADDYVSHNAIPGLPPGREGFQQIVDLYHRAFPDLQFTLEDLMAEGDKVVVRFTARGTHQGAVGGVPPTGKQATWTGVHIYRFTDDKVVERWGEADFLGLLQQIGEIPALGQAAR